jgi:hypothetical protein
MILLADKGDFENKVWPKLIKAAYGEIDSLINKDTIPRYVKSKHFGYYCAQSADFRSHFAKQATKAGKLLGIKDTKTLTNLMVSAAVGDKAKAKKFCITLEKAEKQKNLMKSLEKTGLI